MDQDWVEIYRSYSADELAETIASLKKAVRDAEGISGASAGSKTFQRDFVHIKNRLQAAIRVQGNSGSTAENAARNAGMWGVPDFSNTKV